MRTRVAVAKAGESADLAAKFAKRAQPGIVTRRLSLADHDDIIEWTAVAAAALARSLCAQANSVRFQYSEAGEDGKGADLQNAIMRAANAAHAAAEYAREAASAVRRTVRELPADSPEAQSRPGPLKRAASAAGNELEELRGALAGASGYGVRVSGHVQVAQYHQEIITSLLCVYGYEAHLVDGLYEALRLGRQSGGACSPLVKGDQALNRASPHLAVACTVLRDDATAGRSGRAPASAARQPPRPARTVVSPYEDSGLTIRSGWTDQHGNWLD
jgi:hypothetical protein